MAKLSAKDMEYRREKGSVSSINYHFVFVPKRRKSVLVKDVAAELQTIIHGVVKEHGWKLLALEVMPDHIHMLINAPPHESASDIARWVKGRAARQLRQSHKHLLKMPCMWSPAYFVATTGQVSTEVIQHYIESQKSK